MVLHLETGGCDAGTDREWIDEVAYDCDESEEAYTLHATLDDSILSGSDFKFQCPTCTTQFSFMSALLQHCESNYCEETLASGPLREFIQFLRKRIYF